MTKCIEPTIWAGPGQPGPAWADPGRPEHLQGGCADLNRADLLIKKIGKADFPEGWPWPDPDLKMETAGVGGPPPH